MGYGQQKEVVLDLHSSWPHRGKDHWELDHSGGAEGGGEIEEIEM